MLNRRSLTFNSTLYYKFERLRNKQFLLPNIIFMAFKQKVVPLFSLVFLLFQISLLEFLYYVRFHSYPILSINSYILIVATCMHFNWVTRK
jgi:hypothetical protein